MRTLSVCCTALGLAIALALPATVNAGPLDEARVKARVATTASGNVDGLMIDYADDCVFQWVGGPFDGVYRDKAAIRDVWERFKTNQGSMEVTLGKVESYTNPKGVTVITSAEYKGKLQVKVRQVFVYRDGKVVLEVWQIDPSLTVAP